MNSSINDDNRIKTINEKMELVQINEQMKNVQEEEEQLILSSNTQRPITDIVFSVEYPTLRNIPLFKNIKYSN